MKGAAMPTDSAPSSLSPYFVLDGDVPIPFFKWRANAEAIAYAQRMDEGLRTLAVTCAGAYPRCAPTFRSD